MTGATWRLEWAVALRRRRLLAWNVGVPLLLLGPVALSGAAPAHRAAVYAVFVVFFGAFGTGIPLVRDADAGRVEKLLLTGYGARRWLAERVLAHALLDLLQLLPALALVCAAEGATAPAVGALAAATAVALVAAGILGALLAAAVRSMAEGALAEAAVALAALHLAGAFRTARSGTAWAVAQRWNPFRPLVTTARDVAAGGPAPTGDPGAWLAALAATAALALVAAALAPVVARRLSRPPVD